MNLHDILQNEVLPSLERPSRYVGTEFNAVHKDPAAVELRAALAFPDLYEMGLGNLGILILYAILNREPWCWCERAYAPPADLEAALRERGLPLFTQESKTPLRDLDLLGFTLQSELTYTNIVNMLDLGGIPIRAEARGEDDPLVCAGGPSAFNPEPLAPFMDFMVIGDGEEVIVEIARLIHEVKGKPRRERLGALAAVPGVYVPSLYPMETLADCRVVPAEDGPKITKRIVQDLDAAPWPAELVVPFTQQIHDRAGIEVIRGCTHGCRFCQAGMVTRPVRERSVETIGRIMEETLDRTGYEEVSLVSLSTCDYSRAAEMVGSVAARARRRQASVSLPSLRLDTFSVDLADQVADVRRSGLTFAPEAATPRLRAVINKPIPDEGLLTMAREAFRRGWTHIKLYFMIGLPTETDEDIGAIVDLCLRALGAGKSVRHRAMVNLGVSTFVPKAFTPFQWAGQISYDESRRRQELLRRGFDRNRAIKFGRHKPEATFVEGILSRADRRAADVIEAAWRHGARMDSSDEFLRFDAWQKAVEETGFSVDDAFGERDPSDRLPWDHIDMLVPKQWLRDEWTRALAGETAEDCRRAGCRLCGVNTPEDPRCAPILERMRGVEESEAPAAAPLPLPEHEEPPVVMRVRFRIGREGEVRFVSHLELVNAWIRILRRANAPLAHSQGFHTHPKVTFSTAPPVGEESHGDYMEILLTERLDHAELLERVRAALPMGVLALDAREVHLKTPSLMSLVTGAAYTFTADANAATVAARADEVLAAESLPAERLAKGSRGNKGGAEPEMIQFDLRPMIRSVEVRETDDGVVSVDVATRVVDQRSIRTRELVALLGLPTATRVLKRETFLGE